MVVEFVEFLVHIFESLEIVLIGATFPLCGETIAILMLFRLQIFHDISCSSSCKFLDVFGAAHLVKPTVPAFQQFQHVETDLFRPIRFSNASEALLCPQG